MLELSFVFLHFIQCSDLRIGWFDSLRICRTVLALVRNVYGGSTSLLSKDNQGHLIPTAWRVVSTSRLQVEETQMIYSRCQCITPVSRLSAPCEWWGAQRSQFAWEDVLGADILGRWMTIQGVASQYNIMMMQHRTRSSNEKRSWPQVAKFAGAQYYHRFWQQKDRTWRTEAISIHHGNDDSTMTSAIRYQFGRSLWRRVDLATKRRLVAHDDAASCSNKRQSTSNQTALAIVWAKAVLMTMDWDPLEMTWIQNKSANWNISKSSLWHENYLFLRQRSFSCHC